MYPLNHNNTPKSTYPIFCGYVLRFLPLLIYILSNYLCSKILFYLFNSKHSPQYRPPEFRIINNYKFHTEPSRLSAQTNSKRENYKRKTYKKERYPTIAKGRNNKSCAKREYNSDCTSSRTHTSHLLLHCFFVYYSLRKKIKSVTS